VKKKCEGLLPSPQLRSNISALNGIRGVAVAMVFLFHAQVPGFSGSFLGVDIFFVLSGFLITVLLLQEFQRQQRISLKFFYMRRILRLMPALLFMLVVYLLFFLLTSPDAVTSIRHLQDAALALFYASNWTRAFDLNRPYALGHCWSLSIEEQFYAVWPLFLLVFLRFPSFWRSISIGLLLLASWIWRIVLGLFVSWNRSRLLVPILSAGALISLSWLAVKADWQTAVLYQWQYALVAVATALLILEFLDRPQSILSRFFSFSLLAKLGVVSYGIYLWHYPVLHALSQLGCRGTTRVWLAAGLTLLFSLLSWCLVEQPIQRFRYRYESRAKHLMSEK